MRNTPEIYQKFLALPVNYRYSHQKLGWVWSIGFSTYIQTFWTHTRSPHILLQALTSHTGKTWIHTNNIYHKRTHIHQTCWILWLPHQVPPSLTLLSSHLILLTKYHPHWVLAKSHQRFLSKGRKTCNISLPRTGPTHRTESQLLLHQSLHRSHFPPKVILHIRPWTKSLIFVDYLPQGYCAQWQGSYLFLFGFLEGKLKFLADTPYRSPNYASIHEIQPNWLELHIFQYLLWKTVNRTFLCQLQLNFCHPHCPLLLLHQL